MHSSRREFLLQTLAASSLITAPRFALANLNIGNAKLTTVSDGHLSLPRSFIEGDLPASEVEAILAKYDISEDSYTPPCNVTLYQDEERVVLFDVGSGSDFQPSAGTLMSSLDELGIAVDDVTHVVFTHAHPDHIWGVLDDFDEPAFPNATYMMGRSEWDYWWNPETVNTIGEARTAFAVGAKRRMEALEDKIEHFDDNEEILPGILSVLTPGHTPGHMSFEVRKDNEAAMVIGDAIGNHHIAFHRPDWLSGSDQDQELGAKTRVNLFDRIVNDNIKIAGFHLPLGGIGHAEKTDDGYVFIGEST